MTNEERQEMERRLYSSNEAKVWAAAFCELFDGYKIGQEHVEYTDSAQRVDENVMMGWFSNAMETAAFFERQGRRDQLHVVPETGWAEHAS